MNTTELIKNSDAVFSLRYGHVEHLYTKAPGKKQTFNYIDTNPDAAFIVQKLMTENFKSEPCNLSEVRDKLAVILKKNHYANMILLDKIACVLRVVNNTDEDLETDLEWVKSAYYAFAGEWLTVEHIKLED